MAPSTKPVSPELLVSSGAAVRSSQPRELHPTPHPVSEMPDPRQALVSRIIQSPGLERCHRLRELLIYLTQRSLDDPTRPIPEHEVGVAVFGRAGSYDTNLDNIVRVQVTQLRKRLAQYFSTGEGRSESWILEIPKGCYRVVFVPREAYQEKPADRASKFHLILIGCLALSTLVFGSLFVTSSLEQRELKKRLGHAANTPSVERLWRALFANGRKLSIVQADANLAIFSDIFHKPMNLTQYDSFELNFENEIRGNIVDPRWQTQTRYVRLNSYVTVTDAKIAEVLGRLGALYGYSPEITFARTATANAVKSENVILLGNSRANPWVELFDDSLNFHYRFDYATRQTSFVNENPATGEPGSYLGEWSRDGYCQIAARKDLAGKGNVLILSGTSSPLIEACGDIITSEQWIARISSECAASYPYFEALFKARILEKGTFEYGLVAKRCEAP